MSWLGLYCSTVLLAPSGGEVAVDSPMSRRHLPDARQNSVGHRWRQRRWRRRCRQWADVVGGGW